MWRDGRNSNLSILWSYSNLFGHNAAHRFQVVSWWSGSNCQKNWETVQLASPPPQNEDHFNLTHQASWHRWCLCTFVYTWHQATEVVTPSFVMIRTYQVNRGSKLMIYSKPIWNTYNLLLTRGDQNHREWLLCTSHMFFNRHLSQDPNKMSK